MESWSVVVNTPALRHSNTTCFGSVHNAKINSNSSVMKI
jgi:hypothetical protein